MMSGIRGKNTKPELQVRSILHHLGFRFRIHVGELHGKPDIVLPRYRAAIFVHGCFWHGHDCPLFKYPSTRPDFWREKIEQNRANDDRFKTALLVENWRVGIVWECALKGCGKNIEAVGEKLSDWLRSNASFIEVSG